MTGTSTLYQPLGLVTGIWCDGCLRSSAVRVVMVAWILTAGRLPTLYALHTVCACTDCGATIRT